MRKHLKNSILLLLLSLVILLIFSACSSGGGSGNSDSTENPTNPDNSSTNTDIIISFIEPVQSQIWETGSEQTILWSAHETVQNCKIELSLDDGQNYFILAETTPNSGSYSVAIIDDWETMQARLKITDVDNVDNEVISELFFIKTIITIGKLKALIQASDAPDTDNDGIPDDIEKDILGTNPDHSDSDKDALSDYYELFQSSVFNDNDLLPDEDKDDVIAALDIDDDGNGIHDGENIDSDNDGIANYLEIYGFTYDSGSGKCLPMGEDYNLDIPYYKTNPNQRSSDEDPFDDLQEVSKNNIDTSISAPGNQPMVPALPQIVISLKRAVTTLNADIQLSESNTLSESTTMSTSIEIGGSMSMGFSFENSIEAGVDATIRAGLIDYGEASTSLSTTTTFGSSFETSLSSTYARASDVTTETASEWSRATTTNPNHAADLKLHLRADNIGTACASNIRPTLTIKLGDRSIKTLVPSSPINLLEPGATYPSDNGSDWVVEKDRDGDPIALTLEELKIIETGVPIIITVTQMDADVTKKDENGQYEDIGKWIQYEARCKSVCARFVMDLGDGNIVNRMIYADDKSFSPEVTLWDAFHWGINRMKNSYENSINFDYYDRKTGQLKMADIEGWDFLIDNNTLKLNNINGPSDLEENFNIGSLKINSNTKIYARAPRNPAIHGVSPQIDYPYHDKERNEVGAWVTDYDGIQSVSCQIGETSYEMIQVEGSGKFYFAYGDTIDGDTIDADSVIIEALNRLGDVATETAVDCKETPVPEGAIVWVGDIVLNMNNKTVTALVDSGAYDLKSAKISIVDITSVTDEDMIRIEINNNEPNHRHWKLTYNAESNDNISDNTFSKPENFKFVIINGDDQVITEAAATFSVIGPHATGEQQADYDYYLYYWRLPTGWKWNVIADIVDLDTSDPATVFRRGGTHGQDGIVNWTETLFPWLKETVYQNYVESTSFNDFVAYFDGGIEAKPAIIFNSKCRYKKLNTDGDFDFISREKIKANQSDFSQSNGNPVFLEKDDLLYIKTTNGRYAKLKVIDIPPVISHDRWNGGYHADENYKGFEYKFLTYKKDSDF